MPNSDNVYRDLDDSVELKYNINNHFTLEVPIDYCCLYIENNWDREPTWLRYLCKYERLRAEEICKNDK